VSALERYLRVLDAAEDPDALHAELVARHEFARRARSAAAPVKTCPVCAAFLPASAFGESTRRADGMRSMCRACEALASAARRQRGAA